MYGHQLNAGEPYFGPVPQGQDWTTYETTQDTLAKNLAAAAGIGAASLIHPVFGLAAGIGWLIQGGTSMHHNKPKTQGG
jgi:hypothetical protein